MTSNLSSNSLLNQSRKFESHIPVTITNQAVCKDLDKLLACYIQQTQRVVLKDQSSLIDLSGIRDAV